MKLKDINEWIDNLSIGVGHGVTNQMEGLYQMVTQPRATLQGLYALGQQAVTDPRAFGGMAVNALAETGRRATSGPLGFGEVLGENLSPSMFRRAPTRQELITYHGSPHRINNVDADNPMGKFDLSKIGTGEGAQAYGHGIYLAEEPGVARTYMSSDLNGPRWMNNGKAVRSGALHDALQKWANPDEGSVAPAIERINDFLKRHAVWADYPEHSYRLDEARTHLALLQKNAEKLKANKGHFYTVDLPDEHIAKMLDWDAPLSEQPEAVRKAIEQYAKDAGYDWKGLENSLTGEMIYRQLQNDARDWAIAAGKNDLTTLPASQARASQHLRDMGIPGIKYFDGGSRSPTGPIVDRIQEIRDAAIRDLGTLGQAGVEQKYGAELARLQAELNAARTRNFVIFDGDTAKILKRE